LRAAPMPVIIAAGQGTRGIWIHEAAEALATELGRPLVEFHGGHAAFVMRPRAFAAQLRSLLEGGCDVRPVP